MRYIVKLLVTIICMSPLAAYAFGSADDVRIAKNGPTIALASAKPLGSAKDVTVDRKKEVAVDKKEVVVDCKALDSRLANLDKQIKALKAREHLSKEQAKEIAEGVLAAKGKELDDRVNKKIIEIDNKQATENEADEKRFAAQDKRIDQAVKYSKECSEYVAPFWTQLMWVTGGVIVLFIAMAAIGILNFKRKSW